MIWNLYLPPPRGAADVGSCSDGVSVAARSPVRLLPDAGTATRRRGGRTRDGRARLRA